MLADPEHERRGGVRRLGSTKSYGKTSMGIKRSTFLIDEDGKVARAMLGIRPAGHAAAVLGSLSPGS